MTVTAPFRTVFTHHTDRPGSCRTLETASGFEVYGMTSGYGDYMTIIHRADGRVAARIEWTDSQTGFAQAWTKRELKFPADVHAAMCDLFPFLNPQETPA